MTPERWQQVDEIFQAAIELKAEERPAFVGSACAGDEELRREVESLITADKQGLSFVDEPAFQLVAGLLATGEPELAEGQSLGHYEIVGLLGRGGMGEVYLAKDKLLNRRIALKLLPADYTKNKDRLRRFQQEALAASALNHPNIITIHEIGQVDNRRFFATEFVDGETLRQRIKRGPLRVDESLDIAIQVCSALVAAHKAGIVHRDIKPENIMPRTDGYVKVLDFGLAKLTEQREQATADDADAAVDISSGLLMGTVKYMSPEQARGQQVDPRSDIFSLGVVLYEMLTGRPPFEGKTSHDVIASIQKTIPGPLPNVADELQAIINKALCKERQGRYQTVDELAADLKKLTDAGARLAQSLQAVSETRGGSEFSTSEAATVSTASTLELLVSEIKQHKTGALFAVATLSIVVVGFIIGWNRLGKQRASPGVVKITRVPNTDKTLNVAISPNGQYLAFTEMTDIGKPSAELSLWVQEIATNSRRVLIPPADVEYRGLTYSRDGSNIFYVSKRALHRIPETGGQATKVLADVDGSISFSPDGRQFTFVRFLNSNEAALMIANVDGSGERQLATRRRPEFIDLPAWSPKGDLIACAVGVVAKNHESGIVGFAVTTGEEKRITEKKWDEVTGRMTWLPDGSGLMVPASENAETQVWQVPYPSGEPYRITSDPFYKYSDLDITNDGKNLVAIKSASRSGLWIAPNGDSATARPITSGEHQLYRHVAWTPDGRILYASSIGTSRDIWIMNADGTEPKQLTVNVGVNLQPQPSGRYIVFSSNRANKGAFNLWRMNIDGSNPVQLTHGRGEGQPVCSPDGRWVVYSQGGPNTTPRQKTLWKISIDGGQPVQLSDTPSSGAAISPDSTLIACWYAQDSSSPIKMALIPMTGGQPIKTFDVTQTSIHPVRWSLDGQSIRYIEARPFLGNIWSQPLKGGPPQQITNFTSELIQGFDWSRDGHLVCSRLHGVQDVVLISDF